MNTGLQVKKLVLSMAAVFAVTAALYVNSVSDEYIWDDDIFVARNAFVRDCSNLRTAADPVYLAKVLPVLMSARPLVNVSLLLDTCSGSSARGMRATNILLHASNSVLVFTAAYVLTGTLAPAALAGLLFGLHPAAAEPVAIITFRSQLLCAFFFLTALLTGLVYARRGPRPFLALSVLSFGASMLSNEAGVTFPLLFFLFVLASEKDDPGRKRLWLHLGACAAAALFYLWFRLPRGGYALSGVAPFGISGLEFLYPRALMPERMPAARMELLSSPPWSAVYADLKLRFYTMASIAAGYLRTLALPYGLKGDYNPPVVRTLLGALPGFGALAAVLFGAFRLRRAAPLAAAGITGVLAALLPVLGLVPIYNIKADRYLYLPLIAFVLTAAAAAARANRLVLAGLFAYALVLGGMTFARNPVFRSGEAFFAEAAGGPAPVPRAEINLAAVHFTRGEAELGRESFRRALAAQDNYQIRLVWAEMELYLGSKKKGRELLEEVLKERPGNEKALRLAAAAGLSGPKPGR